MYKESIKSINRIGIEIHRSRNVVQSCLNKEPNLKVCFGMLINVLYLEQHQILMTHRRKSGLKPI